MASIGVDGGVERDRLSPTVNGDKGATMVVGMRRSAAIVALAGAAVFGLAAQGAEPAVSRADDVVCPAGMYWDIYSSQCLYYDVDVYLNPPNPIVGAVGPVAVGPGPIGPGRR